eukprot:comp21202_c0_seq2/m.45116 comp21202_c0_seq2/g.45116  ORF comp21202_c0_seq2/g.45116 comp21202_c0_seq2/m.45116 type:complete len:304 (+) comp21202_c0_seq2:1229-2140(+)
MKIVIRLKNCDSLSPARAKSSNSASSSSSTQPSSTSMLFGPLWAGSWASCSSSGSCSLWIRKSADLMLESSSSVSFCPNTRSCILFSPPYESSGSAAPWGSAAPSALPFPLFSPLLLLLPLAPFPAPLTSIANTHPSANCARWVSLRDTESTSGRAGKNISWCAVATSSSMLATFLLDTRMPWLISICCSSSSWNCASASSSSVSFRSRSCIVPATRIGVRGACSRISGIQNSGMRASPRGSTLFTVSTITFARAISASRALAYCAPFPVSTKSSGSLRLGSSKRTGSATLGPRLTNSWLRIV